MNGDLQSKFADIIRNGYDFKLGDYIGAGFNLVQKNLGGFILYTILFFIISFVVSLIPLVGPFANGLFISPALTAGFYLAAHRLNKGEKVEFGAFFKGFDHVGQLALTVFVTGLITLVSLIPFFLIVWDSGLPMFLWEAIQNPMEAQSMGIPPLPPSWSFLLILPAMFLSLVYSWAVLFVIFYGMGFWEAMEASRKILTKKWPIYLVFIIICGIIMVAGAIALCVGLLFTIPAVYCMQYAAFADVTQLNSDAAQGGDDIERHLVE